MTHASLAPHAPPSADPVGVESAFCRLDDLVCHAAAVGTVVITCEPHAFSSVARHVGRRCASLQRPFVSVGSAPPQGAKGSRPTPEVVGSAIDPWRELARRLRVPFDARSGSAEGCHPGDVARSIARAASGHVLFVAEHGATEWGSAVAAELRQACEEAERRLLVIVARSPSREMPYRGAARASVGSPATDADVCLELGALTLADRRRWWSAVVEADGAIEAAGSDRLSALDDWWERARREPLRAPRYDPTELGAEAQRALSLVGAAGQGLDEELMRRLALVGTVEALVERGLLRRAPSGHVEIVDGVEPPAIHPEDAAELANALAEGETADAWSTMRAAELWHFAADPDQAQESAFAALVMLGDGLARRDLWDRWVAVLERHGPSGRLPRLVASAEHALDLGDGDRADAFAREAMGLEPQRFDVLLLHGRSSHARGDVTLAALSLTRALSAAEAPSDRARAAGMMAQVRYMAGDPDQAERFATEAIEDAAEARTRLEGRNVLGKLLLSRESWSEAETHFAEDAHAASTESLHEEELRARLNRGIAVLYLGRRDEARGQLEQVLQDAERWGNQRAVAFTLSNLATIAILEHDFPRALDLLERAIVVRRRLGGRVGLVQPITNLAEMRLRLGLVDEAEQALRFGLQACAEGLPLSRYAYFAKVASCIHLERGDTVAAAKELATAISGATGAGDRSVLAQCYRIAARIALEDGDVPRARQALDQAATLRHTAFGQAELAVLRAELARSEGAPFLELTRTALSLAQTADDPESLRDAHVLMLHAMRVDGDGEAAASHLRAALRQRDRVAQALPDAFRRAFLGRRELAELAELEELEELETDDAPLTSRSRDERVTSAPVSRRQRASGDRPIVGESSAMRSLRATVRRVAGTDATVLIHGPTGTGKELVAEAVHRHSARRHGPLVKVNCAALVETLLLSELFGHEKGAFTGASSRRRGRFELAEGGTLFLDEIGDISARTQVALLRVLQDGSYERVGGTTQLHANVRIVCATHRDLKAMVERGEFREDLYYRLCGVLVTVPALRERLNDLPALCDALLAQAQERHGIEPKPLSADALELLGRHAWPGNVRELENALRVAALFATGDRIVAEDFLAHVENLSHLAEAGPTVTDTPSLAPGVGRESHDTLPPPSSSADLVYAEIRTAGLKLADMKKRLEQECITKALIESGGNITKAAALLGMKRPRLSQLVKQYDLGKVVEEIKS